MSVAVWEYVAAQIRRGLSGRCAHLSLSPLLSTKQCSHLLHCLREIWLCTAFRRHFFLWLLGCRGSNRKKHSKLFSKLAMTH